MKSALMPVCLSLVLGGCGLAAPVTAPEPMERGVSWREVATDEDRQRLRGWRDAWVQALAKARASGRGAEVAREGALLQPDSALPWTELPEGQYRCRVIKLGAKSAGMLDYVPYPAFDCRLRSENGVLGFAKLSGSQRPIGLFFPDNGRRMIFLGTLQLGDENIPLRYGGDRERNMAGIVERIGERRWRLALPFPHFESTLDVIELIPSG